MNTTTPTRSAATSAEDHWSTFDSTDVAIITEALRRDKENYSAATHPEIISRITELGAIFEQRETAYYGS